MQRLECSICSYLSCVNEMVQVLARRGLLRVLYLDAIRVLDNDASDFNAEQPWPLLERVRDNPVSPPHSSPPLRLRPGLTLHLYTSSVPCGNAALRRWAKPAKRDEEAAWGASATDGGWPSTPHPRLQVHARHEGQVGAQQPKIYALRQQCG